MNSCWPSTPFSNLIPMSKTTHFEDLKSIVGVLNKREQRIARQFIVCFDRYKTEQKNKSLKLFNLVAKKPLITFDEAMLKISPKIKTRSFERTCLRLVEKLEEAVTLEIMVKTRFSSHLHQSSFLLEKQVLSMRMLSSYNLKKYTINGFQKIADKGEYYGNYSVEAHARYFQLTAYSQFGAFETYRKARDIYLNALNFDQLLMQVKIALIDTSFRLLSKGVREAVNLPIRFPELDSFKLPVFIRIRILLLLADQFFVRKNYHAAAWCFLRCHYLYQKMQDRVQFVDRLLVSLNLVANQVQTYQLVDAKFITDQFLQSLPRAVTNRKSCLYIGAVTYFYLKGGEIVSKLMREVLALSEQISMPNTWDHLLLIGSIYFSEGNYKAAKETLVNPLNAVKSLANWEIGRRILLILTYIELDWLQQAESEVASLKTHLQRSKKETDIRPRDEVILRMLQQLVKHSFNTTETVTANPKLLIELQRTEDGYRWEARNHEVIVFHHWLLDKAEGKPYVFRIPEEALAWNEEKRLEFEARKANGTVFDELNIGIDPKVLNQLMEAVPDTNDVQ